MSTRIDSLRSTRWGLAALVSLSLPLGTVLTGCGGGKDGTDTAHVTISEPSATTSTAAVAAPAPSGTTPAAAKPAETTTSTPPTASGGAEGWGTLKGRVIFGADKPPAPKVLVAKGDKTVKDGDVCAKQEIDSERLVVDAASKGVRNVIVYIPKPTKVSPEAVSALKSAEVVFDQKNCRFVPHVLAAMKGQTVQIKSSDPVGHNANAVGLNNNKFNLPTQPLSSMPYPLRGVDKPGKVGCDIHGWMEAYWLVLDNPYFAVTDAQGNFEIKNVPAGEQKVVVWAEAVGPGYVTAASGEPISIKAGGETAKDYTIDPAKVK
ncbi:MAG: hypothetical protein JWN86_3400 [Planctomycetota bacterium]|nr:hypothetical protein [Planctomycetota bacterium]